eukprot:3753248-Pleurochrysis_carterae.AAC.1
MGEMSIVNAVDKREREKKGGENFVNQSNEIRTGRKHRSFPVSSISGLSSLQSNSPDILLYLPFFFRMPPALPPPHSLALSQAP